MINLHYYYNVKYLEEIANSKNSNANEKLLESINTDDVLSESIKLANKIRETKDCQSFSLVTTYPGLLFGSGYPHLSGVKVDGELQVGFNFDYITGVPYYPGSSLKGVIRHMLDKTSENESLAEYITGSKDKELLDKLLESLDKNIFIGAYIVGVYGENKMLMDIDYITPHSDELKNPIPIPFIRINPDVVLEFFFIIKDENSDKDENREYLEAYKRIITEFGIGAKTNVGYGRMKTCNGIVRKNIPDYNKMIYNKKPDFKNKDNFKNKNNKGNRHNGGKRYY